MGSFTTLTWFRSVRVPQLFTADAQRTNGHSAIIDSYYDVLIGRYLGKPPFEWLMAKDDPYFSAASAMAEQDWKLLPKADVLVFLHLNEETWADFMKRRDRDFDRSAQLRTHFEMQELMLEAAKLAADEHNTKLLIIDQFSGSPEETARNVTDRLERLA